MRRRHAALVAIVIAIILGLGSARAPAAVAAAAGPPVAAAGVAEDRQDAGERATEERPAGSRRPERPARDAGDVGARLHDSAKAFGEALLEGVRFAGRTVLRFFAGPDSPREPTR
jgi:hypothetical protein